MFSQQLISKMNKKDLGLFLKSLDIQKLTKLLGQYS